MKGIRLLFEEDKAQPWLVYVNPHGILQASPQVIQDKGWGTEQEKVDDQKLPLTPEVVDNEPNQEKKKGSQYNPQCDS